jgi:hypothetical protein
MSDEDLEELYALEDELSELNRASWRHLTRYLAAPSIRREAAVTLPVLERDGRAWRE